MFFFSVDKKGGYNFRTMEFVNKLYQFQRNRRSVRRTLLEYGNKDTNNSTKPLIQLSEEEITVLILNWIPRVLKKNEGVRIRINVNQDTYDIGLKNTKRVIQVRHVVKKKKSMKHLYYWRPGETFNDNATLVELRKRQDMADTLNKLEQKNVL